MIGDVAQATLACRVETFQKPRRLRSQENPLAYARGSETQYADTEPRP